MKRWVDSSSMPLQKDKKQFIKLKDDLCRQLPGFYTVLDEGVRERVQQLNLLPEEKMQLLQDLARMDDDLEVWEWLREIEETDGED